MPPAQFARQSIRLQFDKDVHFGDDVSIILAKAGGDIIDTVTLRYRIDADGQNPLGSTQNETYAGGPEVGSWITVPMTRRAFPTGNVFNDPSISFTVLPQAIAEQFSAHVSGLSDVLLDYRPGVGIRLAPHSGGRGLARTGVKQIHLLATQRLVKRDHAFLSCLQLSSRIPIFHLHIHRYISKMLKRIWASIVAISESSGTTL